MSVNFKKIRRTINVINTTNNTVRQQTKVYPVITYKYTDSAKLKEVAKEISTMSGVSEGNAYSVLKDFRSYLKKTLLGGRPVNIDGLGYFYLSAQSEGTDTFEAFDSTDITALRICFRASKDIRLSTAVTTRTDGLTLKDVDRANSTETADNEGSTTSGGSGSGSSSGEQGADPLGD